VGRRYVRGGLPVLLAVALVALAAPIPSAGASGTTSGPVLALTLAPPSGPAPLQVSLLATLTPSTTAAVFNWSFGDGTSYQVSAVGSSDPVHQFLLPGQYLVEVTAATSTGVLEANQVVNVGPSALEVQISTSRDTGPAPLTVEFGAFVSGGTQTYSSVAWGLGDGQNGSGLQFNYTYTTPGVYTVNVTVTDSSGAEVRASTGIYVDPPVAAGGSSFTVTPEDALAGAAAALGIAACIAFAWGASRRSRGGGAPAVPPGATGERPQGGPSSPVRPRSLPPPDVQVNYERVLSHLYWTGRRAGGPVGRHELTREGIATELHLAATTVGRALQRLERAGAVSASLEHVPGAPRRVRCYALTPRGESAARALARPAAEVTGPTGDASSDAAA